MPEMVSCLHSRVHFCFFGRLLFHFFFFFVSYSLSLCTNLLQLDGYVSFSSSFIFKAAQLFSLWQLSNGKCLGWACSFFLTVKAVVGLWCGLSTVRMKLNEMRGESYSTLRLDSSVVVVDGEIIWLWWYSISRIIMVKLWRRQESAARDSELLHTDTEAPTGLCLSAMVI